MSLLRAKPLAGQRQFTMVWIQFQFHSLDVNLIVFVCPR